VRFWWISDSQRLGAEKAAVEALAAREPWFSLTKWTVTNFRLALEGDIEANGVCYPIRLIYPDQFPAVPAWVEPQSSDAKWSAHQFGPGGSLCLELRPDNWSPKATGADLICSAYKLLDTENPDGEGQHGRVPSAHDVGDIQSYAWSTVPILTTTACIERLRNGPAEKLTALRNLNDTGISPILVTDEIARSGSRRWPDPDLWAWRTLVHIVLALTDPPITTPSNRDELAKLLALDLSDIGPDSEVLALALGPKRTVAFHSAKSDTVNECKLYALPDDGDVRSARAAENSEKSVAIIGAGSVGSKIAEMLVRSGQRDIVLVDGDVLLPGNIERHTLDWRDVGLKKANAVRRRLQQISPGVNVRTISDVLSWQRSAKVHASQLQTIAECDVIVDATGDTATALMLGAIADDNGRPFFSVQVFEGGIGALIARSLPGRDPPFVFGLESYNAFCEVEDVEPPPSGRRRYESLTAAGEPVVADDIAVTIAAAHAARSILDAVDDQTEELGTAWLLIGCRKAWLFHGHGHIISLDVGGPRPKTNPAVDLEAVEFARQLGLGALDEIKNST